MSRQTLSGMKKYKAELHRHFENAKIGPAKKPIFLFFTEKFVKRILFSFANDLKFVSKV